MRADPSVLHLDLDAFFAAVEQRDKPSLRGRPVVVGGIGPRGVVATASYEARAFGVRSAMSTREARARCPHAAFLAGRFAAYHEASAVVMAALRELSPLVEALSLDEAYVDLAAVPGRSGPVTTEEAREVAARVRATVAERTGLTASVGIGSSKLIAKIASELGKPDGLRVVASGTERDLLRPLPVRSVPGVGPATAERLARWAVRTVGDLEGVPEPDLVDALGGAHGRALYRLARAADDRPVVPERESKSVSTEDTFEHDVTDPVLLGLLVVRMAARTGERLRRHGLSGRTVTLKLRLADFTTTSRSTTLPGPTDDDATLARVGRALLAEAAGTADLGRGVRLVGVGVSGLADWVQDDLFGSRTGSAPGAEPATEPAAGADAAHGTAGPDAATAGVRPAPARRYPPGADVVHAAFGPGWVWGGGLGRVTVRFETRRSPPGPVRTFREDDPALQPAGRRDQPSSSSTEPPRRGSAAPPAGPIALTPPK